MISKPTRDSNEIAQIGTISANSDETIGVIIAEAMETVGKEGVITVEEGKSLQTELDVVEGMQFEGSQRLQRGHRDLRRPDQGWRHRPSQGGSNVTAERSVGFGPASHDGSHDRRQARKGWCRWWRRRHAGHGWHGRYAGDDVGPGLTAKHQATNGTPVTVRKHGTEAFMC